MCFSSVPSARVFPCCLAGPSQVGTRLRLPVSEDKCLVSDLRQAGAGAASGDSAVLEDDTKAEVRKRNKRRLLVVLFFLLVT